MQIILLTHERELSRVTNTGKLALAHFPQHCRKVIWSRVQPDKPLQLACETGTAILLFPASEVAQKPVNGFDDEIPVKQQSGDISAHHYERLTDIDSLAHKSIVILDATWQEARKMMRQSPYLQQASKLSLSTTARSQYQLRRNQLEGGLCTLECIALLFSHAGMSAEAERLQQAFALHNG
ncbi:tRNA-uridine aminocarboxypropyltransferase [Shewanella colwelliana]|uniref:tRNA-uridine aminocarboxypropyltransferase n=1 Tax=Shewanella colwelliana TaxID=23 RepID=UPI0022AEF540|nr:tRNA-uridine aminocarboxypropyltransferase [Shewanella colwelliana]MCZ4338683.1 DTW domain-containing protein [Shewanella colwelliana]